MASAFIQMPANVTPSLMTPLYQIPVLIHD